MTTETRAPHPASIQIGDYVQILPPTQLAGGIPVYGTVVRWEPLGDMYTVEVLLENPRAVRGSRLRKVK